MFFQEENQALTNQLKPFDIDLGLFDSDTRIEKSRANIHQTLDPKLKITASQAKALNAVQYKLQRAIKNSQTSVSEFLALHIGNLTIKMKSNEFRKLINCDSRNIAHLRAVINDLKQMSIGEDTLDQSGSGRISFRNMFIFADYTDAFFICEIPESTTRLLVTDKPSAIIDCISVAQNLSSKYAIFLNDLLEEWSFSEKSDDYTILIQDSELRNLMKIPFKEVNKKKVYSYPQPSVLKQKVIKKATEEINEADLRFKIVEYDYRATDDGILWYFNVVSVKTQQAQEFNTNNAIEIAEIRKKLKELKLSDPAINSIISSLATDYDLAYVTYNLDIVKNNSRTNPAGYFMTCIEKNKDAFEPIWKQICLDREIEKKIKQREYQKTVNTLIEQHTEELVDSKTKAFVKHLATNPEMLDSLQESFAEHLSAIKLPSAQSMLTKLQATGMSMQFLEDSIFVAFLKKQIKKTITEDELTDYRRAKGTQLDLT